MSSGRLTNVAVNREIMREITGVFKHRSRIQGYQYLKRSKVNRQTVKLSDRILYQCATSVPLTRTIHLIDEPCNDIAVPTCSGEAH